MAITSATHPWVDLTSTTIGNNISQTLHVERTSATRQQHQPQKKAITSASNQHKGNNISLKSPNGNNISHGQVTLQQLKCSTLAITSAKQKLTSIVTTTSVTKQIHNVTTSSVTNNQGHNIWPHVSSIRHEQQWPKHLQQNQGWQQHLPSLLT